MLVGGDLSTLSTALFTSWSPSTSLEWREPEGQVPVADKVVPEPDDTSSPVECCHLAKPGVGGVTSLCGPREGREEDLLGALNASTGIDEKGRVDQHQVCTEIS